MQTNRGLNQPFIKQIPPLVVGQLMQDDILKILFGNIRPGQHDTRAKKANQQRRGNQRIDAKLHGSFHARPFRKQGKLVQPLDIGNRG